MERGNNNQPGTETITANGDRIRAGGWAQPSGAGRGADSLAFWHDNESQCEAVCTWRALAEDARRSHLPDSQNGAPTHLCGNRHGPQSCRPAQRLWPAFHESACRVYLPEGRTESTQPSRCWWSSRKLNKRCFVFQVYSIPGAGDRYSVAACTPFLDRSITYPP